MATKAKTEEVNNDETVEAVDTSETVPAGTQTTSDAEVEVPTEVTENEDAAEQEENLEEVFADDTVEHLSADDFPNALGTVKEGGVDVPWGYIDASDFDEDSPLVRTADSDDGNVVRWNVQHAFEEGDDGEVVALVDVQATPGQTFTLAELPDIAAMEKAGINVVQFLSGLPVRADLGDDEVPRRGIPA